MDNQPRCNGCRLGYIELLSAVLHTVVEAGSRRAGLDFVLIHFVELTSVHLFGAGREDYAFAFLDFQLEIARHIKVFGVRDSAFAVFGVLDSFIPVWLIHEFRFLA